MVPGRVVRRIVLLLILTAALGAPAAADASTIVYQCGEGVCAVDPDTGAAPRTLTAKGRMAGVTRDGKTASWVPPSGGFVQAPVAGGAARTVFTGEVVAQPSMSPDGTQYLYWYPGPDGFGGLNAVWINRVTVAGSKVDSLSYCGFCATSHGWLNTMAIAAFPAETKEGEPSEVCRIATSEEVPGVSSSCVKPLASDSRGGIGFPSGNRAGTEIVAALTPGERTGIKGRIVRYSLATGAPIADVTTGTADTAPAFSYEGDRVVFERGGQIVVHDLGSGAERVVAQGLYPFWGGARTRLVRVAKSLRARTLRKGAVVRVRCIKACRVKAALKVSGRTARKLGASRTIAKASGSRRRAGTLKLRLRATRKAAPRLARLKSYRATLRTTINSAATTVSLRIRR